MDMQRILHSTSISVNGEIVGWGTSTLDGRWLSDETKIYTKDKKVFDNYEDGVKYLIQQINLEEQQ